MRNAYLLHFPLWNLLESLGDAITYEFHWSVALSLVLPQIEVLDQ
jgi:hypothetical protein